MADSRSKIIENRRKFMRQSLFRLARMGVEVKREVSSVIRSRKQTAPPQLQRTTGEKIWLNHVPEEMSYHRLGRANLMMSRVAMGCASIRAANVEAVTAAVDRGVNLLVTAPNYEGSERALGSIMPSIRDRVWIATQMPPLRSIERRPDEYHDEDAWVRMVDESLDASLARLEVDCIDLFLLQAIDEPWHAQEPSLHGALLQARDRGKIRHVGLQTHRNVHAVIETALECDLFDVMLVPVCAFNLAGIDRLLDRLREARIGVIATHAATGYEDVAGKSVALYELSRSLTIAQLAHLHTLHRAATAGCLIQMDSTEAVEHFTELARMEFDIGSDHELDSILCKQYWPACSSCGTQLPIEPSSVEPLFEAECRRWGALGLDGEDDGPDAALPEMCPDCLEQLDREIEEDADEARPNEDDYFQD